MYENEDARISSYVTRVRLAFSNRILQMDTAVERLERRIRNGYAMKLSMMESALQVLQTRINAADPRKIMERGYALAVDSKGVVLKGAAGVSVGDEVSVMFADGTIDATVTNIK